ncbi:uncharacterized protein LOC106167451 [Lingula anatina]|uniref:Uncharacterized protein LOC106167451 n=1 Tax=Lingula anatina TaxID=7574 RepID=A0A1S3IUT0_LINAN|nr:uncharacterized protein LOC106167451 [Lingula anatina]|eukprot:XP_013401691.1 uncharacterized protein LOC106167451 [Lingula anatina]
MSIGFVTILVTVCLLVIVRRVGAVCCPRIVYGYCGDCSFSYYACGVGSCDRLKCNCEGGCRSGCAKVTVSGFWTKKCNCESARKRSAGISMDYSIDASVVFSDTDTDRNEQLSRDEYIRAAKNLNRNARSEDIHAEFTEKDKNGDNMISLDEFDTKM